MKNETSSNLSLFREFLLGTIEQMDAWKALGGLDNDILARLALSRALLDETVKKFL